MIPRVSCDFSPSTARAGFLRAALGTSLLPQSSGILRSLRTLLTDSFARAPKAPLSVSSPCRPRPDQPSAALQHSPAPVGPFQSP